MKKLPQITAIDIGSSKVTTVISTFSEEEEKIRVVGVSSVPSKGIRKSQVVDIDDAIDSVTESVESAERMAGFSVSEAVISVSGIHIESQNSGGLVAVQDPESEISSADVERVVEAAQAVPLPTAREILHVLPRYFIVDNQDGIKDPVGMSGVRLESDTHIITGASTNIRNLVKVVSEIGIDTESIVFSGLASAESVLTDTEKELGVVVVDIGGGTTSVCIYVEGALSHSAVIPVGAKNITNDIAIGLRVSLDTAEAIKRVLESQGKDPAKVLDPKNPARKKSRDEIDLHKIGIKDGPRRISRKAVLEGIMKPRVVEMFNLLKDEVRKSGFANKTPAGIVLTGGGALTYDLKNLARKHLNMQVRIATPTGLSGLVDEIKSPEFATVTGLISYAMTREINNSKPSFKLGRLPTTQLKGSAKKLLRFIKSFLP